MVSYEPCQPLGSGRPRRNHPWAPREQRQRRERCRWQPTGNWPGEHRHRCDVPFQQSAGLGNTSPVEFERVSRGCGVRRPSNLADWTDERHGWVCRVTGRYGDVRIHDGRCGNPPDAHRSRWLDTVPNGNWGERPCRGDERTNHWHRWARGVARRRWGLRTRWFDRRRNRRWTSDRRGWLHRVAHRPGRGRDRCGTYGANDGC